MKNIKIIIFVAAIALAVVLGIYFDVQQYLQSVIEWLNGLRERGLQVVALIIYVAVYAVAAVLFVPGSILTLGAGALFGLGWGFLCVIFGATLGAIAAFLVGRYFARDWISNRVSKYPQFQQVYDAIGREGGKIIFFLRLSPLFPFSASNYLYALTSVKSLPYTVATFAGIMPGTLMYVYFGTLIRNVAAIGSAGETMEAMRTIDTTRGMIDIGTISSAGEKMTTPLEWILYGIGLAATVFVTIYATRIARRAINTRVSDKESKPQ